MEQNKGEHTGSGVNASSSNSEFLLQEYQTVAEAFFNLYSVVDHTFRLYLGAVALPVSVAGVILASGILPVDATVYSRWVALVLLLIGLLGVFITLSLILIRIEMLAYARVINKIRSRFCDLNPEIRNYLRLPTGETVPPYFSWLTYTTFQMAAIALWDSAAFSLATWISFASAGFLGACAVGLASFVLHFVLYWLVCRFKEHQWRSRPEFRF